MDVLRSCAFSVVTFSRHLSVSTNFEHSTNFSVGTSFKGEQMVGVFNRLNIKVSCLGNHDLDYGVPRMKELIGMTKPCKWLISNLKDESGKPVGDLGTWAVEDYDDK